MGKPSRAGHSGWQTGTRSEGRRWWLAQRSVRRSSRGLDNSADTGPVGPAADARSGRRVRDPGPQGRRQGRRWAGRAHVVSAVVSVALTAARLRRRLGAGDAAGVRLPRRSRARRGGLRRRAGHWRWRTCCMWRCMGGCSSPPQRSGRSPAVTPAPQEHRTEEQDAPDARRAQHLACDVEPREHGRRLAR